MEEDESVPVSFEGAATAARAEEDFSRLHVSERPEVRENVDAGVHVIDLKAMRAQLESGREPGAG